MDRKVIFQKKSGSNDPGYIGKTQVPLVDPEDILGPKLLRKGLSLPQLGELSVVRHYLNLAKLNFSVDTNFYPLGSCTMKYNPKINEALAALEGFSEIHPYQEPQAVQGALELIYQLNVLLCEITGMKQFSFQASSGAQGELTGLLMIHKFHQSAGNRKTKVIIPDSAHGTNPATAAMCGYKVVVVESDASGLVDMEKLRLAVDEETAAIMLTNPNTLGLFEENILEIADIVHQKGGFLYYDGANFNPLLGITNPAKMGFDLVHLNLHKTFSTPHGSGGPGLGAVGVGDKLIDFLPVPLVVKREDNYYFDYCLKNSIGRLRAFYGNFSVLIRAYAYILRLGQEGLLRVAKNSVVNANYLKEKLRNYYCLPYPKACMHEVVFSAESQKEKGASALDIAKRLIDYRIHPPTIYFPLIVKEALMIEPTETESKETLDKFIEVMLEINREIELDLERVKNSPQSAPVKRVDEVRAARFPDLRWRG
ncbi:MAG: aminomethyl-transferring glycine dehydrogenase subunit GcvPB [Candidatus Omnitrophica bacterium]|nr:aminomethyl-transferring glycine dehydrogenase subunit GcvPB [Candidatus Omnitrophota bacterium]MBU2044692.1 aminomethyl-transferring glycine dehydrogenase subunit GcvPB [Candidatus Omnitrophota bacterium]MBU2474254.1 aminomethyl-transferring glycine dehydrogenase subunit GcvPB [Candidatus Omnitrophota bacterium]